MYLHGQPTAPTAVLICEKGKTMAKKRELDNLDLDMIRCKADGYGCHYGAWKATQDRPVTIEKKTEIPEGWKICQNCGKPFKLGWRGSRQIYCEIYCQKQAQQKRISQQKRSKNGDNCGEKEYCADQICP